MTELFDEEEKLVSSDDEVLDVETEVETEVDGWDKDIKIDHVSDARRRLEDLLDEKKLREELDDFLELDELSM
jgi:hypothetical protein